MAKTAIPSNYIEYMSDRVSFNGKSNYRKSLVLWALKGEELKAGDLYELIGGDLLPDSFYPTVKRLRKLGYINSKPTTTGVYYHLTAKGLRFLYAVERLAPLDEWLAGHGLTNTKKPL